MTLLIPSSLNQLIRSIYEGVIEDPCWNSFLTQLTNLLSADLAVAMLVPLSQESNKVLVNQIINDESIQAGSVLQWLNIDPFQDIPKDQPIRLDNVMNQPSSDQKLTSLPHQITDTQLHHILAINIITDGNPELQLKLRVARTSKTENFNEQDTQLLSQLVEHFKLALRFFDQMAIQRIERNALADAINQFMLGTLILDSKGTIVASNRVARDCIEQEQLLSMRNDCLVITNKTSNKQLYQALSDIGQSNNDDVIGKTITISQENDLNLGLIIRPIRPEDALAYPVHAHAVVFISNSQGTREISAGTLKELFGFTDSEAKVAAYLANGHTLTEAATALSVSINTAKTHAKNIYEKTGVNKQTKFIQLVSNSVARVS